MYKSVVSCVCESYISYQLMHASICCFFLLPNSDSLYVYGTSDICTSYSMILVQYHSGTSDICTSYTVSLLQYKYKQLCLKVSVRYIYQQVLHDGLSLSSWVFISVQKWRWTRNSKETLTPFLFNVARMQVSSKVYFT